MSGIISLLTDFGTKDGFVGIMKGVILNIYPDAKIMDLSNEIPAGDLYKASFVLQSSYKYFPPGTIFLCVVDPGVGTVRDKLLVRTDKYYFIAPDNGLLTGVLSENKYKRIISIQNKEYWLPEVSNTFHGRDIFAPVAAYLARVIGDIGVFGPDKTEEIVKLETKLPVKQSNRIEGNIIYIDNFGNLITNIPNSWIKAGKIKIKDIIINSLSPSYSEAKERRVIALIGSYGFLELAINNESAAKVLNAKIGEPVYIDFLNDF